MSKHFQTLENIKINLYINCLNLNKSKRLFSCILPFFIIDTIISKLIVSIAQNRCSYNVCEYILCPKRNFRRGH